MMTVETVLALVKEWEIEKAKTEYVPHRYKRNGEWKESSRRQDAITTPRYKELCALLRSDEAKVFKCAECGKAHNWFDLATWYCVPEKEYFVCFNCYNNKVLPRIQRKVAQLSLKANMNREIIPEAVWKSLWEPQV
jgi:hypothetical protein